MRNSAASFSRENWSGSIGDSLITPPSKWMGDILSDRESDIEVAKIKGLDRAFV
jgi:hypothetical protein